ncbi:hypothetical protein Tel_07040 [Candidatus Tenderia electrophaga]|jgi:hypothetical protein|uniref:Alginate export domain-containing protein n=1 Tax=Candidatus Tenderia electrophaga TaxID=1748243 RepID=A0A0S2TCR3_9GAMM|nr:hypothetical protein Tel_07040 [Candidatus Tenderia electrophaga]
MQVTWLKISVTGMCLITPALLYAAQQVDALEPPATPTSDDIQFGPLSVGGAMRVNYTVGDYPETEGASRAVRDGGNFSLDTFRLNLDLLSGAYLGKLEYRWYDGYNFLHTGWLGYRFADQSELQVGVNRVPFGPHPHYGVSQSWFFDQHYYVGLADDMDLGVRYSKALGDWQWDVGYYLTDEGSYIGFSEDSARYSYDVVNESGGGYAERHQVNLRGVYTLSYHDITNELGFSLQYGQLESQGRHDDGDHRAASLHMINRWGDFALTSQLTYYRYDVDAAQPLGTDQLVQMGAYDFPVSVAAEAWIPALSLIYRLETPGVGWLDSVTPYVEYSAVHKQVNGFNDSELMTLGAAWANGGWYIYTDLVYSNGNEFVGGEAAFGDRLGANADDTWQARFNINFGLYF